MAGQSAAQKDPETFPQEAAAAAGGGGGEGRGGQRKACCSRILRHVSFAWFGSPHTQGARADTCRVCVPSVYAFRRSEGELLIWQNRPVEARSATSAAAGDGVEAAAGAGGPRGGAGTPRTSEPPTAVVARGVVRLNPSALCLRKRASETPDWREITAAHACLIGRLIDSLRFRKIREITVAHACLIGRLIHRLSVCLCWLATDWRCYGWQPGWFYCTTAAERGRRSRCAQLRGSAGRVRCVRN